MISIPTRCYLETSWCHSWPLGGTDIERLEFGNHRIVPCHMRKNTRSLEAKLSLNQNNQIKEVPTERGASQTPWRESLDKIEKS